jgi:uncharacterized protein YcfJ
MQLSRFLFLGLLCANFAHAEITVVDEFSQSEGIHTAKVISKEPIYRTMTQTISKPVCRNVVSTIHYGPRDTIEVTYRDHKRCSNEFSVEQIRVLSGYSVYYEYNGKYFSAVLDHDPGEYVSVHSGK